MLPCKLTAGFVVEFDADRVKLPDVLDMTIELPGFVRMVPSVPNPAFIAMLPTLFVKVCPASSTILR